MAQRLRTSCLCVSLSVFVYGLLGFATSVSVAGTPGVQCPCDFFAVPMTSPCWQDPADPKRVQFDPGCRLTSIPNMAMPPKGSSFLAQTDANGIRMCSATFRTGNPDTCTQRQFQENLTLAQLEACQCELQAYATALNQVEGIQVSGGPPYECSTPPLECAQPPPPPIPTLNQWGMIIMAGVLGLFAVIGLFVMKRSGVVKPSS